MKYVKKPIPIEAIQWTGSNFNEIENFMIGNHPIFDANSNIIIDTLEGKMSTSPGSYIIRGVEGEYYPCRKDIFEATYSPINEITITCDNCNKAFLVNKPNIYYDYLNKKYLYWTVCPFCGTKNDWE